ncbi:hypothetical protein EDD15DRAFT_2366046 [Pisolithus albus]|nr:hypothetical protein EDD15DRAFT_2366046 [Pisolithus albus]
MEDTVNTGGVAPRATFTRGTANRGSTRGAKGRAPAVGGEPVKGLQVHWDQDPTRTERLIRWLLSHAADRHILFHDKNTGQSSSAPPPAAGDKPSGRNKKEVRLAIAKCIFEDDSVYGEQYATNPDKFQLLKEKYREHAKSLKQTGGGVAPGTENNLREAITKTFPYFDDLDLIWKGNPSFDARPFTSNQQKNRAEEMLSLVWGGATCPGDNPPAADAAQGVTTDAGQGENSGNFMAADGYGENEDFGVDHEMYYGEDQGDQGDQEDQEGLGVWNDDMDVGDEQLADDNAPEPVPPFSRIQTWQQAVTPGSSRQARPSTGTRRHTLSWDSCDAFKSADMAYRNATPMSIRPSSLSDSRSQHRFVSPYSRSSETSLTRGTSRKSSAKRIKSDLQGELDSFKWEVESLREERMQRNVGKYEYALQSKELAYRRKQATLQRTDAEASHRRQTEEKKLDIQFMDAQARMLEQEAKNLCLKIRLAELQALQGGSPAGENVSRPENL